MENVNLNTEIHCHFEYCVAILNIAFPFCYTYACRHFRQVEFAEHIDPRERCQHLAPFRQSQCIRLQTGSLA